VTILAHNPRYRLPTKDLEAARKLITIRFPSAEKPFIENYAIILKVENSKETAGEGGEMIGVIGIPRLSHDGLAAEVGYGLIPEFWGKGYALEALKMFAKYYFNSRSKFFDQFSISYSFLWARLRKGRRIIDHYED
jgi:RimJ/RimL family protein N-acetyltransferase